MDGEKKEKKLSREYTPEQVAEETKGVDDTLPEAATTQRRPLFSDREAGGAEHWAGEEEEGEEPQRQELPAPDPPRQSDPRKGA